MYVFRVQARTGRGTAVRRHIATWARSVGDAAVGWLGTTGGVDSDGRLLVLSRFASEEAAYITCDLPEHERWWEACARLCDSAPSFSGGQDVKAIPQGGDGRIARVIVAQSRLRHEDFDEHVRSMSPPAAEVLGGYAAWIDGEVVDCVYLSMSAGPAPGIVQAMTRGTRASDLRVTDLEAPVVLAPRGRALDAPRGPTTPRRARP